MDKSLDGQIKGLGYKLIFPIENHMIERSQCMIQTQKSCKNSFDNDDDDDDDDDDD